MKCIHCQGELKRGVVPFHVDRKGVHLSLDHVPAWVCGQCGEPAFDQDAVESIQAILHTVDEQAERLLAHTA